MRIKDFSYSLLISLIWHLFWLKGIDVSIINENFSPHVYPAVSFLGSILPQSQIRMVKFSGKGKLFLELFSKKLLEVKETNEAEFVTIKKERILLSHPLSSNWELKLELHKPSVSLAETKIQIPSYLKVKFDLHGNIVSLRGLRLKGEIKKDYKNWFKIKSLNYRIK